MTARSLLFNLLAFGWGLLIHLVSLPLLLLPRRFTAGAGRLWIRVTFFLLRTICRLDFQVQGLEKVPQSACIVAAKHQSAWDTLAFPLVLNDPCFVLKRELLWVPLFGWFLKKAGVVAIDRGGGAKSLRSMTEQAAVIAAAGRPIVIFPEGTRTAPGTRRPYHPGVAALARQLRLPTVPVALDSGRYWGRRTFIKKPGTIILRFLDPIEAPRDRKSYLATLEQRIEEACANLPKPGPGEPN